MTLRRILDRHRCRYCGEPLKRGVQQSRRRFCSDAHKQKAARRRKLGLPENLQVEGKRFDLINAEREVRIGSPS
jgi:ribosomal protein L34E